MDIKKPTMRYRSDKYITALRGEIYGEVSLFWGAALTGYFILRKGNVDPTAIFDNILYVIIITISGAFLTRMLGIYFKIKSPLFSSVRKDQG